MRINLQDSQVTFLRWAWRLALTFFAFGIACELVSAASSVAVLLGLALFVVTVTYWVPEIKRLGQFLWENS